MPARRKDKGTVINGEKGVPFCSQSSYDATIPCPIIYFKIGAPLEHISKLPVSPIKANEDELNMDGLNICHLG